VIAVGYDRDIQMAFPDTEEFVRLRSECHDRRKTALLPAKFTGRA
jgi:hypothetical protein